MTDKQLPMTDNCQPRVRNQGLWTRPDGIRGTTLQKDLEKENRENRLIS